MVATILFDELEDDAIISVDSGTTTSGAARCINIRRGMHFSLSGTLASMGCGLPYAIGLSLYRNQIHERVRDLHHRS